MYMQCILIYFSVFATWARNLWVGWKELEKYIIVPWISRTEFRRLMDRIS